jgi:hypothetical protein
MHLSNHHQRAEAHFATDAEVSQGIQEECVWESVSVSGLELASVCRVESAWESGLELASVCRVELALALESESVSV